MVNPNKGGFMKQISTNAKQCLGVLIDLNECNNLAERAVSKMQVIGIKLADGDWEAGIDELLSKNLITDSGNTFTLNISLSDY